MQAKRLCIVLSSAAALMALQVRRGWVKGAAAGKGGLSYGPVALIDQRTIAFVEAAYTGHRSWKYGLVRPRVSEGFLSILGANDRDRATLSRVSRSGEFLLMADHCRLIAFL